MVALAFVASGMRCRRRFERTDRPRRLQRTTSSPARCSRTSRRRSSDAGHDRRLQADVDGRAAHGYRRDARGRDDGEGQALDRSSSTAFETLAAPVKTCRTPRTRQDRALSSSMQSTQPTTTKPARQFFAAYDALREKGIPLPDRENPGDATFAAWSRRSTRNRTSSSRTSGSRGRLTRRGGDSSRRTPASRATSTKGLHRRTRTSRAPRRQQRQPDVRRESELLQQRDHPVRRAAGEHVPGAARRRHRARELLVLLRRPRPGAVDGGRRASGRRRRAVARGRQPRGAAGDREVRRSRWSRRSATRRTASSRWTARSSRAVRRV